MRRERRTGRWERKKRSDIVKNKVGRGGGGGVIEEEKERGQKGMCARRGRGAGKGRDGRRR